MFIPTGDTCANFLPPPYRKDLIRESARKEFEDARYETDPEVVSEPPLVVKTRLTSKAQVYYWLSGF